MFIIYSDELPFMSEFFLFFMLEFLLLGYN